MFGSRHNGWWEKEVIVITIEVKRCRNECVKDTEEVVISAAKTASGIEGKTEYQ